jgi:hypothetical protein
MGKSVVALTGDAEIDFADLMRLTDRLGQKCLLADSFGFNSRYPIIFSIFPATFREIYGELETNNYDFLDILELTLIQLASDPRDYVYALLGHPSAQFRGLPIKDSIYTISAAGKTLHVHGFVFNSVDEHTTMVEHDCVYSFSAYPNGATEWAIQAAMLLIKRKTSQLAQIYLILGRYLHSA